MRAHYTLSSTFYASLGVTMHNLDARYFTSNWTHSLPIGLWHSGFSAPITTPYSFVFASPVASFGIFANDVEAPISVTVHTTSGTEPFVIATQGGSDLTQFHGFSATTNMINRIDFLSSDYHMVDDVQFGFVPEPTCITVLGCVVAFAVARRRRD